MKPRIVEYPALRVVGVRERFLPGKVEDVPEVWERFICRMDEIENRIEDVHYGVMVDDSTSGSPGFFYYACVGVKSPGRVPEGMSATTVPAGTYAVFTHRGPITELLRTMNAIWREWLPASGLKPTGAPDFERYDERFKLEEPDSEVDVYLAVAKPRRAL